MVTKSQSRAQSTGSETPRSWFRFPNPPRPGDTPIYDNRTGTAPKTIGLGVYLADRFGNWMTDVLDSPDKWVNPADYYRHHGLPVPPGLSQR